jgi:zinc transporter ZupT
VQNSEFAPVRDHRAERLLWASIAGAGIALIGMVLGFAGEIGPALIVGFAGTAGAAVAWRVRREILDRAADASPQAGSLIQQRMRLDRSRTNALLYIAFGVAISVLGLLLMLGSDNRPQFAGVFSGGLFLLLGIVQLIPAERRRREFERQHGRDAGRQKPIARRRP